MVLGIALLGEKLTLNLVAGLALFLCGILVGNGAYARARQYPPRVMSRPFYKTT